MAVEEAAKTFEVDGYRNFIFTNRQGKVYTPSSIYDKLQYIAVSVNREEAVMAAEKGVSHAAFQRSAHVFSNTPFQAVCVNPIWINVKILQDMMGPKYPHHSGNLHKSHAGKETNGVPGGECKI